MSARENDPIWISNLPKLIISALTIVCITLLIGVSKIAPEAGLPILSANAVYIVTNGLRGTRDQRSDEDSTKKNGGDL